MFVHHCSSCDRRQLVLPGQIAAIDNTERGIVAHFACWCGAPQSLLTGSHARPAAAVSAPASAAA